MPRKTEVVFEGLPRPISFNEAAARCRGKLGTPLNVKAGNFVLQ